MMEKMTAFKNLSVDTLETLKQIQDADDKEITDIENRMIKTIAAEKAMQIS